MSACLLFAVLAPMYFAERSSDDTFAFSAVIASPRDLHVLTVPVRLSRAPDLTLMRAVVYDYGPATPAEAAPGAAMSQVVLDTPVFTLNAAGLRAAAAAGRSAPEGAEAEPVSPLIQQIAALGFDLVTVKRGTLHIAMLDGSIETLTDIQAEVKRTRRGQIAALGSFTVRGQRLAFDASFGQPSDRKQPMRWPLQMSFKASSLLQGSFDGHLDASDDLQLTGQTELAISSLRRAGRWFGLPLYLTDGFNAASLKGELVWARRSLAFEKARIAVDGNEGNGRVALNMGGERPLLEATLNFASLNLTPYVEAARMQLFGLDLPGGWWSTFDLSLPMIRHLDADMRVSAQRLTVKGYALGQAAATITAQAGKLHADITELELPFGGTVSAQVTTIMSEAAPRYAVRAKLDNVETGPATAQLLGAPALAGRANVELDLTSTGYSLAEVTQSLSGKAALAMPEGGRLALDLRALRQAAKSGANGWASLAKAQTSVDRLEARALIIDGVAFAEETQARAGDNALTLGGRLGLVDGNMEVRLNLKSNVPHDQPVKLWDAGGETLTVSGAWSEPVLRGEDGEAAAPPR
jgi:AsmA protein